MFFSLVILVSLVIAVVRGHPLDDMVARPFRLWLFAVLGALLHLIVNLKWFAAPLASRPLSAAIPLGAFLYLASFAFLIVFLLANLGHPGLVVLLIGMSLNLIAVATNGGQMPGDPGQLAAAGLLDSQVKGAAAGLWSPFGLIGPTTSFPWLGDRLFMPMPFRQPVVLSVGDLIIALGCFLFCNDPFRRVTVFSSRRRFGYRA